MNPISFPLQLIRAAAVTVASPRLFAPLLVPYGVAIVTYAVLAFGAYEYREELISLVVSHGDAWYWNVLEWAAFVLNLLLSAFLAWLIALSVSGFFIELYVERVLVRAGAQPVATDSFGKLVRSTVRGLVDALKRAAAGILVGVLFLLTSFFPVLWIFPAALSAWLIGFDLLYVPLFLLGIHGDERRVAMRSLRLERFASGAWMMVILSVPFAGLLALPLGYFVAAERVAEGRRGALLGR